MSKKPTLQPTYDEGKNRWRLAVPASFSDTGKRRNLFFTSKRLAELEAERLRGNQAKYGTESARLSGVNAQDAARALEALKAANIDATLYACVQAYIEQAQRRFQSVTLAELLDHFQDVQSGKSAPHQKTIDHICGKMRSEPIIKKMVTDINHCEIETVLNKHFKTPANFNLARRSIRPAFRLAVKKGWASEDPFLRIDARDTGRHEIKLLTLAQARRLMTSCKDYRKDEGLPTWQRVDARSALAAVALMLFGGIRPTEATRLTWDDVDMDAGTVLVTNRKAKTDRSRYFTMPDTLRQWLETVPASKRHGAIVPANWPKVWQAVRQKAGIKHLQDACRKTFATAHLGAFNDVNRVREILGHENGDVLFTNYRGLMKPADAKAFWQITPSAPFEIVRTA